MGLSRQYVGIARQTRIYCFENMRSIRALLHARSSPCHPGNVWRVANISDPARKHANNATAQKRSANVSAAGAPKKNNVSPILGSVAYRPYLPLKIHTSPIAPFVLGSRKPSRTVNCPQADTFWRA